MNPDADWRDYAACAGWPITVFFPDRGGQYDKGRAVCASCRVRTQCLAEVLTVEQPAERHGLVAGLTPHERARLARDLDLPARRARPTAPGHGTVGGYGRGCRCEGCRDARRRYVADRRRARHPDGNGQAVRLRLRTITGSPS